MTFLRNGDPSEKNRSLYAISGLDYVAHEDIIPYKSKDKVPIHHELFDKFLGEIISHFNDIFQLLENLFYLQQKHM